MTSILMALAAPMARAEGTSCNQPTVIDPDGRIIQGTIPANGVFIFAWGVTNNRSYSVEARFPFVTFNSQSTVAMSVANPADCSQTATATVVDTRQTDPQLGYSALAAGSDARVSVVVTATPGSNTLVFAKVTNNDTVNAAVYTFSVSETTLFSTRWSTFSGFFTSYGFTNTTNTAVSVTLTLTDTAGTVVATSTQSVPAGRVVYTTTSALGVAANDSGSASLSHNGPPGAILADAILANFGTSPPTTLVSKFEERHSAH